jgi:site-specific DNA-cytosine methylase
LQQPVEDVLSDGWDLMIAHPPCTHLAVSGSRHFHRKQREQAEALDFVRLLMAAPIDRWCIENPVSIISSAIAPPLRSSSRGSLAMAKPRRRACGSRICHDLNRRWWLRVERQKCIGCRPDRIGGRSAAAHIRALLTPWPNSGGQLLCRQQSSSFV